MPGHGFADQVSRVQPAGTAVFGGVGIEDFFVNAFPRHADAESVVAFRHEIEQDDQIVGGLFAAAGVDQDGLLVVIRVDPFEAVPAVVLLPQGGLLQVECVQSLDKRLVFRVGFVAEQEPFQAFVIPPFDKLP